MAKNVKGDVEQVCLGGQIELSPRSKVKHFVLKIKVYQKPLGFRKLMTNETNYFSNHTL